jgi:hypothetical protein
MIDRPSFQPTERREQLGPVPLYDDPCHVRSLFNEVCWNPTFSVILRRIGTVCRELRCWPLPFNTTMRLRSPVFLLFAFLCMARVHAQRDSSLTREFARMSAKERARVAREEEAAAQQDAMFQQLMREGEEHFQSGRYNDALSSFRQARSLRPLNVYPKVKIQDLEALIARQAEVPVAPTEAPKEIPSPPLPPPSPPPAASAVEPPVTVPPKEPAPRPEKKPSPAPVRHDTAITTPTEGIRTFREGRAVVEERTVQEGERLVVWRKVVHPWGEVVHFRDNEAVPARMWQQRFGGN